MHLTGNSTAERTFPMSENKNIEAIAVFKLNIVAYPDSSSGFDSLGEAYYKAGNMITA
jgi:hypothetical protein